ncbi:MAG: hypothetical protein WD696_18080 [Bryobacteraceae bacterium]
MLNLREYFRWLAARRTAGEIREMPGVSIASAGAAFEMFNAAFLSEVVGGRDTDLERRILTAALHFEQRGMGWAYWVADDWLNPRTRRRAEGIFEKHGLFPSARLPGMIAENIAAPVRALPEIEIRTVGDPETRLSFCAVGAVCFNLPVLWFREIFEPSWVWSTPEVSGYVGYVNGAAATTALTVAACGVVGVYNVATLPSLQRHGYGEATVRHALNEARRSFGEMPTVLQSTDQGFSVYRRIGYRTVNQVTVYTCE